MKFKFIVMDIDGTLTDGAIYYSEDGSEIKKFNVKDAAGILAAQAVGIGCMFLTGRKTSAVERRAKDLGVEYVVQGIKDKRGFLETFLAEISIQLNEVLYIGDDLNDLPAMKAVACAACPKDAADEVRGYCDYISLYEGGNGAVRDVIFHYLKEMGIYEEAISKVYGGI